jgi:hypothetical protein
MFVVHEIMYNVKMFIDTFPQLKMISIIRSPVYLVYSWYKRGLGKRWGNDPKMFNILLREKGKNIPWFAVGWKNNYSSLSEMDRIIESINSITNECEKEYKKLDSGDKKKILFVDYEKLLAETVSTLKRIGFFLKRPIRRVDIKKILKKEKLPNLNYSESKQEKLLVIKKESSPEYFKKLLELEEEYLKKEKEL